MGKSRNSESPAASMQLLLVGDDEANFRRLRELLDEGCQGQVHLHLAHSLEEALLRMEEAAYDLALCDYKSGDGMALGLLKQDPQERDECGRGLSQ